jgi:hypothetical protein
MKRQGSTAWHIFSFPQDMNTWNEAQVSFAIATAKGLEAMRRKAKEARAVAN